MPDHFYSYSCDLLKRRPHKLSPSKFPPKQEQLPLTPVVCRHRCKTVHQAYHHQFTAKAAVYKLNHNEEECRRMRNNKQKATNPREEYYSPKQLAVPVKQKPYALEPTKIKVDQSCPTFTIEQDTHKIFPNHPATIVHQLRLDKLITSTYRKEMYNSKQDSSKRQPKGPDQYNLMNTYFERAQQICDSKRVLDPPQLKGQVLVQPKNQVLVQSFIQSKQGVESNSQASFKEGFESVQNATKQITWSKPPLPGKNVYERVASLSKARKGLNRPYSHNQVRNSLDVVKQNEIGGQFAS